MGYEKDTAARALSLAGGDVERACELLLETGAEVQAQEPESAESIPAAQSANAQHQDERQGGQGYAPDASTEEEEMRRVLELSKETAELEKLRLDPEDQPPEQFDPKEESKDNEERKEESKGLGQAVKAGGVAGNDAAAHLDRYPQGWAPGDDGAGAQQLKVQAQLPDGGNGVNIMAGTDILDPE